MTVAKGVAYLLQISETSRRRRIEGRERFEAEVRGFPAEYDTRHASGRRVRTK